MLQGSKRADRSAKRTPNADVSQREVLNKQRGSVGPAYHLVFSSGAFSRGRRRVARRKRIVRTRWIGSFPCCEGLSGRCGSGRNQSIHLHRRTGLRPRVDACICFHDHVGPDVHVLCGMLDSALQNRRPLFKKITQFFFVYTVTCKQRFLCP